MMSDRRTRSLPPGGVAALLALVRPHRRIIVAALGIELVGSALSLFQPLLVRAAIDGTGQHIALPLIGMLIALFVFQALVQGLARYLLASTGETVVLRLRLRLIGHLLRLRIAVYDRHRVADLSSRVGNDAMVVRGLVTDGLADIATGLLGAVGAVAFMIWLDAMLFAVVAGLLGAAGLVAVLALGRMRDLSRLGQTAIGTMSAELDRALGAIRTVRIFRAEAREALRIGTAARSAYTAKVRTARLDATVSPLGELAVNAAFLTVLLVGGIRVANGTSSIADLVAFLLYMAYLAVPIGSIVQAISAIQQGMGALDRIHEVLDMPAEPTMEALATPLAASHVTGPVSAAPTAIEFREVWFGYRPGQPVLRGLSFQVPRRGHVALVGASGAGKSTVFGLVARFYEPDRGHLLLAGREADCRTLGEHRSEVAIVEEHCPVLFGTLYDNLVYGNPEVDEETVRHVVAMTNLDELVARLPAGLHTEVGERGALLSGGERQRLAIARALLCRPTLLLMDEPSAHLDATNEAAVQRAMSEIGDTCALLTIAHRITTVQAADHVLLLHAGELAAEGTHEDLLATDKHYRALLTGPDGFSEPVPQRSDRRMRERP